MDNNKRGISPANSREAWPTKGGLPSEASYTNPSFSELTAKFMTNASAHGLPKIVQAKGKARKVAWVIVFLGAFIYFGIQIGQLLTVYFAYPVAINTVVRHQSNMQFPGVTVCNMNPLVASLLEDSPDYGDLFLIDRAYDSLFSSSSEEEEDGSGEIQRTPAPIPATTGSRNTQDKVDQDLNNMYNGDDEHNELDDWEYESTGFDGVSSDHDFKGFLTRSTTSDLSDLVDVLKPSINDLDLYGLQAENFILQCSFDTKNCSHRDFKLLRNSLYGNCFTFNDGTSGNSNVLTTSKYGARYGLSLTLNINREEYIGMVSHEYGVRVTVHAPDVTPFPEFQGSSAAPGFVTNIGLKVREIKRKMYPFASNCSDGSGILMDYDGHYTSQGCMTTCLQRYIQNRCNCSVDVAGRSGFSSCSLTNKAQERCRQQVNYLHDKGHLLCECPMPCYEKLFDHSVSIAEWPTEGFWALLRKHMKGSIDAVSGPFRDFLQQDDVEDVRENLVRVHVYVQDPTITGLVENSAYPRDRLLADIGGLFGLFLGISVCSAVEVLEFLIDLSMLSFRAGKCSMGVRKQET